MPRHDSRSPHQVRPISFQKDIAPNAQGSVLVAFGNTRVICAATIEDSVPRWMKEQNVSGGWLTAEYSMLPYSTGSRKARDITRGKMDGRSTEIQRLIGRSLRAVVDLEKLGPRTLWVDCDVLQADGGTRTAAITGAAVAIELAARSLVEAGKLAELPIRNRVAAVSVGVVDGEVVADLDYVEDRDAAVDMNVVMTHAGDFVEVQGSGEESVFSPAQLNEMLAAAHAGLTQIFEHQNVALNS
ncbi:MAG: ribonuclease PH [Terrimicrobiaceae bacterium]|nr:ribonuclease PH [Terrimicrobiaceae bacterium]